MSQYRGSHPGRMGGQGPRDGRGMSARDTHSDTVTKYWPDYLKGGYFDEQGQLKIELVTREKVEPLARAMCADRTGLTTHQVRRYFGHCRAIETRLMAVHDKSKEARWRVVWPDVKKLDVAAADGAAKQPPKIPALFHDFIRCNVAAIKTQRDFLEGFLPHFEALVGFGQAHFRRERT